MKKSELHACARLLRVLAVAGLGCHAAHAQVDPALSVQDFERSAVSDGNAGTGKPIGKYVLSGERWATSQVIWHYNPAGQPSFFTTGATVQAIQSAMDKWSDVCNITFTYGGTTSAAPRNYDNVNAVGWDGGIGSAGLTSWTYDGNNRILDADITLNPNVSYLQSLFIDIVTHEAGHMLGLSHSDVQNAVMAGPPLTQYNADQHTLRADDVAGCQALYGPADGGSNPPPPGGPPSSNDWDVFWRKADGTNGTWQFTGPAATQFLPAFPPGVPTQWQAKGVGDVDGDGVNDVVWLQSGTGVVALWLMASPAAIKAAVFPANVGSGTWSFGGIGDVDGDGRADLLWRNGSTGQVRVWYMGASGAITSARDFDAPTTYELRGVGDVNGDGVRDLVWFQPGSGQVALWLMTPAQTYTPAFPGAAGPNAWRPYRIADFDGDGKGDLLWRNDANGMTAVWYLDGTGIADYDFFVSVPVGEWQVASVGDIDFDGRGDLLWYAPGSGNVVRWLMQARHAAPIVEAMPGIGSAWQLVQ
jgi:hypothetical protein